MITKLQCNFFSFHAENFESNGVFGFTEKLIEGLRICNKINKVGVSPMRLLQIFNGKLGKIRSDFLWDRRRYIITIKATPNLRESS